MPGREHAGRDLRLDRLRQPQQPDGVRDLRTRAADLLGELLLGDAEVLQQLLVRRRLFQRVELSPVDVLEQRVAQHVFVGGVFDDGRDGVAPRELGGPQATLAHDQLVGRFPLGGTRAGSHDDRLEHAELADRDDELLQLGFAEVDPRLLGVRHDVVERDLGEARAGDREQARLVREEDVVDRVLAVGGRDEGADPAAEAGALRGRHQRTLRWAISAAASR